VYCLTQTAYAYSKEPYIHSNNQMSTLKSPIYICIYTYIYIRIHVTGWRRLTGSLIFIGHFPQKWRIFGGSFVEIDLQLRGSYESSPPCNTQKYLPRRYVPYQESPTNSWKKLNVHSQILFTHMNILLCPARAAACFPRQCEKSLMYIHK